jgi:hypothetical protein
MPSTITTTTIIKKKNQGSTWDVHVLYGQRQGIASPDKKWQGCGSTSVTLEGKCSLWENTDVLHRPHPKLSLTKNFCVLKPFLEVRPRTCHLRVRRKNNDKKWFTFGHWIELQELAKKFRNTIKNHHELLNCWINLSSDFLMNKYYATYCLNNDDFLISLYFSLLKTSY